LFPKKDSPNLEWATTLSVLQEPTQSGPQSYIGGSLFDTQFAKNRSEIVSEDPVAEQHTAASIPSFIDNTYPHYLAFPLFFLYIAVAPSPSRLCSLRSFA
jgi:hypothetical protein